MSQMCCIPGCDCSVENSRENPVGLISTALRYCQKHIRAPCPCCAKEDFSRSFVTQFHSMDIFDWIPDPEDVETVENDEDDGNNFSLFDDEDTGFLVHQAYFLLLCKDCFDKALDFLRKSIAKAKSVDDPIFIYERRCRVCCDLFFSLNATHELCPTHHKDVRNKK